MAEATAGKSKPDPLIGRVINGRFRIDSLIARGGMGKVYKAEQQPLGRVVALKVLDMRRVDEDDPEFHERFFLEASTAAKLSHPNTVTIFDYGRTDDDVYFIAMEYVDGQILSDILKEQGPMPAERAVHIVVQVARSLREAHNLGVIHRDMKPGNVLITTHADEEDFAKVLDFGLVKDVDSDEEELTQQGTFMGSPKYMSPEQIRGGAVDRRTDVYALGVTLYRMLTGRVPFDRPTQVQTLMAHCRDEVPPLSDENVQVPPAIEAVVMRSLAKEADDRISDMDQFVMELRQAIGAQGGVIPASGDYSMDLSNSGMRSVSTGSGSVPLPAAPAGKGKAPLIAAALLLALGAGGAAAYFSDATTEPRVESAPAAILPAEPAPERGAEPEPAEAAIAEPEAAIAAPEPEPEPEVPLHRVDVVLSSTPSGAEVFVGERSYGTTPARVEWVGEAATPGREISFRFEHGGYRSSTITATIVEGEPLSVSVALAPLRRNPGMMGPRVQTDTRIDNYHDNPY
ncbi:MAG: protein kinase [Myxococcales bacterium]|nr:protein kinase [Myxococcales bacterium]